MKIIIVGAGVSGLATFLQLRNLLGRSEETHQIVIYEAHGPSRSASVEGQPRSLPDQASGLTDSTTVIGNSIGLAAYAVSLLKSIDVRLYQLVKSRGYESRTFSFRTARGHNLAHIPTSDPQNPQEFAVSCPRHVLRDCLHEIVGQGNILYRKVTGVDLDGSKPCVRFDNGQSDQADLVLGTDGVRSIVKRAIFGEQDRTLYAPVFEGFCGVGGFETMKLPDTVTRKQSMVFTFGPTGSFGYCSAAPASLTSVGWWSNWGMNEMPDQNATSAKNVRVQLQERHGTWADPVIRQIIGSADTNVVYPIWTTPDLPVWSRKGAVLLGDAAHTLQATSGQGACQALEDSIAFSFLLSYYLNKRKESGASLSEEEIVELTAKGFYEIRHKRVAAIRDQSRNLYITRKPINNTVMEYIYYAYIYLLTAFPLLGRLIIGNVFKEADGFDAHEQVEAYLKTLPH